MRRYASSQHPHFLRAFVKGLYSRHPILSPASSLQYCTPKVVCGITFFYLSPPYPVICGQCHHITPVPTKTVSVPVVHLVPLHAPHIFHFVSATPSSHSPSLAHLTFLLHILLLLSRPRFCLKSLRERFYQPQLQLCTLLLLHFSTVLYLHCLLPILSQHKRFARFFLLSALSNRQKLHSYISSFAFERIPPTFFLQCSVVIELQTLCQRWNEAAFNRRVWPSALFLFHFNFKVCYAEYQKDMINDAKEDRSQR